MVVADMSPTHFSRTLNFVKCFQAYLDGKYMPHCHSPLVAEQKYGR